MRTAVRRRLLRTVWGLCLGAAIPAQGRADAPVSAALAPATLPRVSSAPTPMPMLTPSLSDAAGGLQPPPDAAPISLNFQQIELRNKV